MIQHTEDRAVKSHLFLRHQQVLLVRELLGHASENAEARANVQAPSS